MSFKLKALYIIKDAKPVLLGGPSRLVVEFQSVALEEDDVLPPQVRLVGLSRAALSRNKPVSKSYMLMIILLILRC